MCEFFSFNSDGNGNFYYFKPSDIKKIRKEGNKKNYNFNSHTSIADYYGFTPEQEDKQNKYEFNPYSKEFKKVKKNKNSEVEMIDYYKLGENIGRLIVPILAFLIGFRFFKH